MIDKILKLRERGKWQAFLHKMESRLGYVLLSLFLTIACVWGFIQYGIPMLAKRAAYALPVSAETMMGEEGLKTLDRFFFCHINRVVFPLGDLCFYI